MDEKKEFFGWGTRKYTKEEIELLIEKVKVFNAGAIDEYLTNHVDKVFEEWVKELD